MNWDQVQGQWKQIKGTVREQWGKLTGGDLDEIAGKRQRLVGKLQERYGYAKERAEEEIEKWLSGRDETEAKKAPAGAGQNPTDRTAHL